MSSISVFIRGQSNRGSEITCFPLHSNQLLLVRNRMIAGKTQMDRLHGIFEIFHECNLNTNQRPLEVLQGN